MLTNGLKSLVDSAKMVFFPYNLPTLVILVLNGTDTLVILVIPESGLTCKDGVVSLVNLPPAGDIGQSMGLPHHGSLRVPNS